MQLFLSGQRFGRLVILQPTQAAKDKRRLWQCRCDCGKLTLARTDQLTGKRKQSCGGASCRVTKLEGSSSTRAYTSWWHMMNRCYNVEYEGYNAYGGRGITVADEWRSFERFYADMGERPLLYTLGRKDNDKGYSLDNCRWETREQQAKNKQNTKYVEYRGRTYRLIDLAAEFFIDRSVLYTRLFVMGWPIEKALTEAVRPKSPNGKRPSPHTSEFQGPNGATYLGLIVAGRGC